MTQYHLVVRVDPAVKKLLLVVANARGETPSDFVRRSILTELARLSFLDDVSKKALGVRPGRVPTLHRDYVDKHSVVAHGARSLEY